MATQKVTKAVIAAAGFGTRFLPQTKAMPKEMLPLIDKPIIQYVVEELVASGIEDIFIQVRSNKRAIEDHFDLPNEDLVANLKQGGEKKLPLIEELNDLARIANFVYVRAKAPYGNAAPVVDVADLLGDEAFIYTFADDFFVGKDKSRFQQMIELHDARGGSVISCMPMSNDAQYDKYGVVGGKQVGQGLYKVDKIVEKPGKARAPSNLASVSSYLFEPSLIPYLLKEQERLRHGQEFYIQPAMQAMINDGHDFWGLEIDGTYYDTGDKLEYLKTMIDFGLAHDELGRELRSYLESKLS